MWHTAPRVAVWPRKHGGVQQGRFKRERACAGEVESLRRQLRLEGVPEEVWKATTITPEQATGTSGPAIERTRRGSNVDAMRLKRELENLRAENRKLRLEGAGELQADEEEEVLQECAHYSA